MYIDTEGTFRPERLLAVAERQVTGSDKRNMAPSVTVVIARVSLAEECLFLSLIAPYPRVVCVFQKNNLPQKKNTLLQSKTREFLSNWIKTRSTICCLPENQFRFKDTNRLKLKRWKKILHANSNHRGLEQLYQYQTKQTLRPKKALIEAKRNIL